MRVPIGLAIAAVLTLSASPVLADDLAELKSAKKLIGQGVDVISFVIKVVQFFEAIADESSRKPSVEITQLDVSSQDLIVGNKFQVVGRAKIHLGNIADTGLIGVDYQDAYVTVKLKVNSTAKEDQLDYHFTQTARYRTRHLRYNTPPENMRPATAGAPLDLEFKFNIQASGDDIADSVTVTVKVKGPEGDPSGLDPYVERSASKTKPFYSRKEFTTRIERLPSTGDINHGDTLDVKLFATNRSSESLNVVLGQVGDRFKTGIILAPNEGKLIVADQHPHIVDHPTPPYRAIRAIVVDPIRMLTSMKLESGRLHNHDETYQPETADCVCEHMCPAVRHNSDPIPTVSLPTADKDPPITGTVTDAISGAPIAGAQVVLQSYLGNLRMQASTDAAGGFSFGVLDDTDWVLTIRVASHDIHHLPVHVSGPVSIGSIGVDPLRLSIRGRVVDSSGTPARAIVRFFSPSLELEAVPDGNGNFVLTGVPATQPGEVRVIAQDPPPLSDFRYLKNTAAPVTIASESITLADVVLESRAAGGPKVKVEGAIVDQSGSRGVASAVVNVVSRATGNVLASVPSNAQGRWSLEVPSASTVEVVVESAGTEVYRSPPLILVADLTINEIRIPAAGGSPGSRPRGGCAHCAAGAGTGGVSSAAAIATAVGLVFLLTRRGRRSRRSRRPPSGDQA